MPRWTVLILAAIVPLLLPGGVSAQAQRLALESAQGLRLHNVRVEPASLQGKAGIRVTLSDEAAARLKAARASLDVSRADRWPQLNLNAGATRAKYSPAQQGQASGTNLPPATVWDKEKPPG